MKLLPYYSLSLKSMLLRRDSSVPYGGTERFLCFPPNPLGSLVLLKEILVPSSDLCVLTVCTRNLLLLVLVAKVIFVCVKGKV